jgi:hypothetical protein
VGITIKGGKKQEERPFDVPRPTPVQPRLTVNLNNISFSPDADTYVEGETRYVMVQFFGMSNNGPVVLSRVYSGDMKVDPEFFKKRLAEKRKRIITTSSQSEVTEALESASEILTEELGYSILPMYCMVNFS